MSWEVTTINGKKAIVDDPWYLMPEEAQVHWDRDVAPLLVGIPEGVKLVMRISRQVPTIVVAVDFMGWRLNDRSFRSVVWFENHTRWGQHWESNYDNYTLEQELAP